MSDLKKAAQKRRKRPSNSNRIRKLYKYKGKLYDNPPKAVQRSIINPNELNREPVTQKKRPQYYRIGGKLYKKTNQRVRDGENSVYNIGGKLYRREKPS